MCISDLIREKDEKKSSDVSGQAYESPNGKNCQICNTPLISLDGGSACPQCDIDKWQ